MQSPFGFEITFPKTQAGYTNYSVDKCPPNTSDGKSNTACWKRNSKIFLQLFVGKGTSDLVASKCTEIYFAFATFRFSNGVIV